MLEDKNRKWAVFKFETGGFYGKGSSNRNPGF